MHFWRCKGIKTLLIFLTAISRINLLMNFVPNINWLQSFVSSGAGEGEGSIEHPLQQDTVEEGRNTLH